MSNAANTRRDSEWMPAYYGNRFMVVKLVGKLQKQVERKPFASLWAAQQEANRLNGVKDEIGF